MNRLTDSEQTTPSEGDLPLDGVGVYKLNREERREERGT